MNWHEGGDTYSPVVDKTVIRMFLAETARRRWHLEKADISNAYINAEMRDEVYVKLPKHFFNEPGKVRRLLKALYGHPKAGKYWYKTLSEFLSVIEMKQSTKEPCLFFSKDGNIMLVFYVDDFLISASATSCIDMVFNYMSQSFEVKRLGLPTEFLGMQIKYDITTGSMILYQEEYIRKIAAKFDIVPGRGAVTPMAVKCEDYEDPNFTPPFEYSSLIGALLFAAVCTRIDIVFSASFLARQTHNPKPGHFSAAKRVLGYLESTADFGIQLGNPGTDVSLNVFSDSDWAGDEETRKSTAGVVLLYNNCAVDWKSTKIQTVALSSTEAEVNALALAVQRIQFINPIVQEFGHSNIDQQTNIYEDNMPAIHMVKNNGCNGKRAKHFDVRVKYIIDVLARSDYTMYAVRTHDQMADFLTKSLPIPAFRAARDLVMTRAANGDEESRLRLQKLDDIYARAKKV
jgi:hypothetical protein